MAKMDVGYLSWWDNGARKQRFLAEASLVWQSLSTLSHLGRQEHLFPGTPCLGIGLQSEKLHGQHVQKCPLVRSWKKLSENAKQKVQVTPESGFQKQQRRLSPIPTSKLHLWRQKHHFQNALMQWNGGLDPWKGKDFGEPSSKALLTLLKSEYCLTCTVLI